MGSILDNYKVYFSSDLKEKLADENAKAFMYAG